MSRDKHVKDWMKAHWRDYLVDGKVDPCDLAYGAAVAFDNLEQGQAPAHYVDLAQEVIGQ